MYVTRSFFFFFNDTATTEIYTLSLHDALPILLGLPKRNVPKTDDQVQSPPPISPPEPEDRKSTRLNSSHITISYAVFCLKKKKEHLHKHLIIVRVLPDIPRRAHDNPPDSTLTS